MTEFGQKGIVSDKDFMIHVLNNLPKEYNLILNGLENHLTATGENALTIDSIHEKLNHRYEKIKSKKEEIYNKQYKQQCWQCGKYDHKPGNWRCPKNKNEKEENEKNVEYKMECLEEYATTVDRKGILVRTVRHGETAIMKNLKKQNEPLTEMKMC